MSNIKGPDGSDYESMILTEDELIAAHSPADEKSASQVIAVEDSGEFEPEGRVMFPVEGQTEQPALIDAEMQAIKDRFERAWNRVNPGGMK